jgi:hypothetical protein
MASWLGNFSALWYVLILPSRLEEFREQEISCCEIKWAAVHYRQERK